MKKRFLLLFLCEFIVLSMANGQIKHIEKLKQIGFENISVSSSDSILYVALEDNIYRWNIKGISVALDSLCSLSMYMDDIKLLIYSEGIPRYVISTKLSLWKSFREKEITPEEFKSAIEISYDTKEIINKLKGSPVYNSPALKTDLVVYPEIKVKNVFVDKNYDIQLNISPALETDLWRGGKSIVQFIFPLVNSSRVFGEEGKYIRPGYVVLKQDLNLYNKLFTSVEAGLFNQNRYGISVSNNYFLNDYILLNFQYAFTGFTYFGKEWKFGTLNTSTWSGKGSYYLKWVDTHINLSVQRYLSSETGVRFELYRMFGETGIGIYGLIVDGTKNAGFSFRVPISPSKQNRKGKFRVKIPNYFNWEYSASDTENKGNYLQTQPADKKRGYTENPVYIKYQLLNL
ncbi:MAG: hypothetical protein LBV72_10915 [Tannerella sp.]|jgi:hypothetical protein|nr:hypothetical protein [Tannerella sp.]